MGGLEKITETIISKAENDAAQIVKKAENKAEEILNAAKLEAEEKRKSAELRINEECEKILQMGQGNDRQETRRIILETKSKAIYEIIDEAKNKIKSMEEKDYLEVLKKLTEKYAEDKEGEIIFSSKDKDMLDDDIKKLLKQKNLKLSEEVCSFEKGFVIRYGKIEINCSIDSIFEEKYSELTDIVNSCITEHKG